MKDFDILLGLGALLALLPGVAALTAPDCVGGPNELKSNDVCNPGKSAGSRANALAGALQGSEVAGNLVNTASGASRIGLPAYEWWTEALHGLGSSPGILFNGSGNYSYATSFANPGLLSAAFDNDLVYQIGNAISNEARAFRNAGRAGVNVWTPNVNPYRDPRWGRGMETPGEDPFRIKGYVAALLAGLEARTKDGRRKVVATCKHYAAYDIENGSGTSRHTFNAKVTTQDLVEYYLPPFQQCARDSKVGSIMCSYNAVNGQPACANPYLLQTVLREHWGWTGDNQFVVSDCEAVLDIADGHKFAPNHQAAAAVAFNAGMDNMCANSNWTKEIGDAQAAGQISSSVLRSALVRQFQGQIQSGLFDSINSTSPYQDLSWNSVNTYDTQTLAVRSARDGMVLLKHDGKALPFNMTQKPQLAMVGMWANASTQMLGAYSGIPPYTHSPTDIADRLGFSFFYAGGPINDDPSKDTWTSAALTAVGKADMVLYFGGIDNSIEAEEKDRTSIGWPAAQLQLINKICAQGKPCVVVQLGSQLDQSALLSNPNVSAILWAGYPGQDGGRAVFDLLTGVYSPAGRLPMTQYPVSYTSGVSMTDMTLRASSHSPGRTYQWFNSPVQAFGTGLHYTTFNATLKADINNTVLHTYDYLSSSNCDEKYKDLCPGPSFTAVVQNIGRYRSDYVALLFMAGNHGPLPLPSKRLVSYARLHDIRPGETREVTLNTTLGDIARVDSQGNTVFWTGDYNVQLDQPTQSGLHFIMDGNAEALDLWPKDPNNPPTS